jgi:hypothetical protein
MQAASVSSSFETIEIITPKPYKIESGNASFERIGT